MKKIIIDSCFLCLLLIGFIVQKPVTLAMAYLLAAIYLVVNQKHIALKNELVFSGTLIICICMTAALTFNHGITPIFYLAATPLLFLSARHLTDHSHEYVISCLKIVYWVFAFGVGLVIVKNRDEPVPLEVFSWSSTNGIPSYLIVVHIAYALAYYLKSGSLPTFAAITTFFVAIVGLGRGSMIAAGLIFLMTIGINAATKKSISDRKFARSFIVIAIIVMLNYYSDIVSAFDLWIEGSKFSGGVLDEHRGRMITDYLNRIDGWTLIFGMDYLGTSIVSSYGGNPHNSFIRFHSFYGLVGLFLIFSPLLILAISNKQITQRIVSVILISISLLRSSTETIFFPSVLDIFYFLYFYIFLKFATNRSKRRLSYV